VGVRSGLLVLNTGMDRLLEMRIKRRGHGSQEEKIRAEN